MQTLTDKKTKLFAMSRIAPQRYDEEMDTVAHQRSTFCNRRVFDVLMEAQHYWNQMDKFRQERQRNKRYTYGDQWKDRICVDGKSMTEEEYIMKQGSVPLKNNLIR